MSPPIKDPSNPIFLLYRATQASSDLHRSQLTPSSCRQPTVRTNSRDIQRRSLSGILITSVGPGERDFAAAFSLFDLLLKIPHLASKIPLHSALQWPTQGLDERKYTPACLAMNSEPDPGDESGPRESSGSRELDLGFSYSVLILRIRFLFPRGWIILEADSLFACERYSIYEYLSLNAQIRIRSFLSLHKSPTLFFSGQPIRTNMMDGLQQVQETKTPTVLGWIRISLRVFGTFRRFLLNEARLPWMDEQGRFPWM
ncbi:hypothetical protein C8J56DRAFT_1168368 [Mycena floridula]|nr:hypothetical protein C8J56DRAFT_1168368 [Mycena floridula]